MLKVSNKINHGPHILIYVQPCLSQAGHSCQRKWKDKMYKQKKHWDKCQVILTVLSLNYFYNYWYSERTNSQAVRHKNKSCMGISGSYLGFRPCACLYCVISQIICAVMYLTIHVLSSQTGLLRKKEVTIIAQVGFCVLNAEVVKALSGSYKIQFTWCFSEISFNLFI